MSEKTQTEKVVDSLNQAYKDDPDAIYALLCMRVPCNQKLVDHPDVVVGKNNITGGWTVSPLGAINGVLTAAGMKRIAMKWSDIKKADGTYDFLGFCIAGDELQSSSS